MTPLAALSPVAPLVLLLLLLCFPTNALPPLTASPPSDPNLNPSVANGLLGLTTPLDAIYVNGVFTRDLEYLIGGCLSLPADILLLNPLTRYELSGLCQSLDKLLLDHPKTDIVEHGQGTRKARFTNPYAYIPKLLGAVEPLVSTGKKRPVHTRVTKDWLFRPGRSALLARKWSLLFTASYAERPQPQTAPFASLCMQNDRLPNPLSPSKL